MSRIPHQGGDSISDGQRRHTIRHSGPLKIRLEKKDSDCILTAAETCVTVYALLQRFTDPLSVLLYYGTDRICCIDDEAIRALDSWGLRSLTHPDFTDGENVVVEGRAVGRLV